MVSTASASRVLVLQRDRHCQPRRLRHALRGALQANLPSLDDHAPLDTPAFSRLHLQLFREPRFADRLRRKCSCVTLNRSGIVALPELSAPGPLEVAPSIAADFTMHSD